MNFGFAIKMKKTGLENMKIIFFRIKIHLHLLDTSITSGQESRFVITPGAGWRHR